MTNKITIKDNLLQVLLSNGFPRLRICTTFDIGFSTTFSDTWTGSPTLHTLNLTIRDPVHQEKLRSLCPRLRRLTTDHFPMDGFSPGNALMFWPLSVAISCERLSVQLRNLVHVSNTLT